MERNRRLVRQNEERLVRENEERLTRQNNEENNEENLNQNAFRNDNRDFGFRRDERVIPRLIRQDNTRPAVNQPTPSPPNISFTRRDVRFRDYTDQYVAQNVNFTGDWESFMQEARGSIVNELERKRGNKIFFSVNVKMRRLDEYDTLSTKIIRIKEPKIILEGTDVNELYDEIMDEINKQMDVLQDTDGSGWIFEELDKIDILTVSYEPLRGSKWLPLPKHIADKKAVINIKNKDEKCFMWCIARALSPTETNPQRVDKNLKEVAKTLNMDGIREATPIDDIPKFENQNPDIAVVVLGLNQKGNVYPIRQSKYFYERKHSVVLLLIKDEENFHYTLVNNNSRLISSQFSNHDGEIFICWNCINVFYDKDKYLYHRDQCSSHKPHILTMPKPGTFVKFKNYQHAKKFPFAVYADIESLTTKIEYCDVNPEVSYTTKTQLHKPISYVFRFVSFNQSVLKNKTVIYTGEDCMDNFVIKLEKLVVKIFNKPQAKPIYDRDEKIKQENSLYCYVCGGDFKTRKKLRDFEYFTGEYLGPCHYNCKSNKPDFIPIFFHNLANYDSHLFITKLASKFSGEKIRVIPTNEQKYISFTKYKKVGEYKNENNEDKNIYFSLRFVDSFKFMSSSLEKLANNLPKNKFKNLENRFSGRLLELAKRKGVFPYDWFDSIEKLKYDRLPPIEEFYSSLNEEGITKDEYDFALEVWNIFGCKTFKDYLELYNLIDTLLLADIFENFREICLENYKIDPAYYYTSPGLFWDAMLKETKIELELLSDIDMFYFLRE